VVLALIPQFEVPLYSQDASVGAGFFPTVILVGQLVICVALIVQHLNKKAETQEAKSIVSKMSLMGLVFLIFYAVLISVVGYLLASLISFTVYLIVLKVKKPMYYVVAWVFVFAIYYLFAKVFFIALPEGMFY
jgi:hypothetical protein